MNKKILSVVLILCLMLAVMPMTAYAADIALCTKCGQRQTVRVTRQYANDKWHRCDLTCTVCDNTWDYWESHIWSGTATCTSGRTCTLCGGSSEPLGRRTAMKRPTLESVSVTPAIRKPRIATAARRPASPRLSARSAAANTARWRHTASLPKKQRRSI